jgi:hypothetical protein
VRPAVIAFDLFFPPDSEWDLDLANGMRAMGGVPIICGTRGSAGDGNQKQLLTPLIREHVDVAGVIGICQADTPWTAKVSTTLPNGAAYPSLSLATVLRCWQPGGPLPTIDWLPDALLLQHQGGPERKLDVTSVMETPADDVDLGVRKGTPFAEFMLEIPTDDDLAQSSFDYRDLFELSGPELNARLDGRVLFIADYRPNADGPFPHPDGRELPGAVMNAVAIERLLEGEVLKRPRYISLAGSYITTEVPLLLLATSIGGVLAQASIAKRKRISSAVMFFGASIAVIAVALLSFRFWGFVYSPLAPLLCLLAGALVIGAIARARASTI